ncbi:VOC family protein [Gracilibacillus salitolerans]|uniref:VOC family protein n=1 Tax=Gracilibacillus salitolerans TaxID=2663022 RepID=A0A5Q2TMZ1_9BACI|nr:VOC family protein [Gracilibacillus salitolerans]QGH35521.1 VOC family protein [Gracilibacillus salitolerans]
MIKNMHVYLVTNGDGQEAIKFYQSAIDAELLSLQTFADLPNRAEMGIAEDEKDRVLNAHLRVGQTDFMLSDTMPGQSYQLGDQVTVAIISSDIASTERIFGNLAQDGKVVMPLQEVFWSPSYGQVTDKFGVTWQISTHE